MKRHINVPVFVPHAGCPHACSFCNQKAISGAMELPAPAAVAKVFRAALENLGEKAQDAELAFFGGSFTAIDRDYRMALLRAAKPFVGQGRFGGIRVSTRPDCVDETVLEELVRHGVTTVELGVQSMSDRVLEANGRGHTAQDVICAARLVRAFRLSLGLQMMTGLYRDTDSGALETARQLAELQPDFVRIYPAVVLEGTRLCRLYKEKLYRPQTLDKSVSLCTALLRLFRQQGIPVIRLGLHSEEGVERQIVAGPWHPAFRELCEGGLMLEEVQKQLRENSISPGSITLNVHPSCVSKAVGHSRQNLLALEKQGYSVKIAPDPSVRPLDAVVRKP